MEFTVLYPLSQHEHERSVATPQGVATVVRAAEQAGFDGMAFSEHPAPNMAWMDAGGHETFDLPAVLGFCSGITTRLQLMPFLIVLPYHSPYVVAKALATLDVLSEGRIRAIVGAGYLQPEFDALAVPFEERNSRFDEAIAVMRGVWEQTPFSHEGEHFVGRDVVSLPGPRQKHGPPIIIGGNSALARRRAAENDGWCPVMTTAELADARERSNRTPSLVSVNGLARQITEVRSAAAEARGKHDLWVQVLSPEGAFLLGYGSVEQHRDYLGRLAEAGVDSFIVKPPGHDLEASADALYRYAAEFIK